MVTTAEEKASWTNMTVTPLQLDRQSFKSGTDAERLAYTAIQGLKWFVTDTFLLYFYDGAAWVLMGGGITGKIEAWGGAYNALPSGYLYCNGAAVSRTTYAALFAIMGTRFGVGDGSTTFNLPDLRAKFPRGAPNATDGGATGGEDTHVLVTAELASHAHTMDTHSHTLDESNAAGAASVRSNVGSGINVAQATSSVVATMQTIGSGTAHENRPAYQEVVWMVKT